MPLEWRIVQYLKRFRRAPVTQISRSVGATVHAVNKSLCRNQDLFVKTGRSVGHSWNAWEWTLRK